MQAIKTKYLAPTNNCGSRVKATCNSGSVTVPWDYSQEPFVNHRDAAYALQLKLGIWPAQATIRSGHLNEEYFWIAAIEAK